MTDKQYDLYFSQIIYREYFYPNNLVWKVCELHGNSLKDDELIEIKWKNEVIEKFKISIKTESIGFNSKRDVPYGIINYNGTETLLCLENLIARRLHEPK